MVDFKKILIMIRLPHVGTALYFALHKLEDKLPKHMQDCLKELYHCNLKLQSYDYI